MDQRPKEGGRHWLSASGTKQAELTCSEGDLFAHRLSAPYCIIPTRSVNDGVVVEQLAIPVNVSFTYAKTEGSGD